MAWKQHIERVLAHLPGQRLVLLTRADHQLFATRVFPLPVQLAFDGLVAQVVATGEGSIEGLPEPLTLALEGYRVRARLPPLRGLPPVVGGGVSDEISASELDRPPPGFGHAFVTTPWIDGRVLLELRDTMSFASKNEVLASLLQLIVALHRSMVVYGDLKPHNVVIVGDEPWLIDLDTMRRVTRPDVPIPTRDLTPSYAAPEQTRDRLTYLASDVYTFGRLAAWLLEAELGRGEPPSVARWSRLLERALVDDPAARGSAEALAAVAGIGLTAGPGVDTTERVPDVTVPWLHAVRPVAGRKHPAPAVTEWVADPSRPGAPAPRRAGAGWLIGGAAAVIAVAAIAWLVWQRPDAPSEQPARAAGADGGRLADPAPPARTGPRPFDLCSGDQRRVAVAYLASGREIPPATDIVVWFENVPPGAVEIYRFVNAGSGRRYVSFELSRESWPDWRTLAPPGSAGDDICWRVGAALVERQVGRKQPQGGKYDLDFLGDRAPTTRELERLGDMNGVASGEAYVAIVDWIEPVEIASECGLVDSWSMAQASIGVLCTIVNPRARTAPLLVTASSVLGGRRVDRSREIAIPAGATEQVELVLTGEAPSRQDDLACECTAATLPVYARPR